MQAGLTARHAFDVASVADVCAHEAVEPEYSELLVHLWSCAITLQPRNRQGVHDAIVRALARHPSLPRRTVTFVHRHAVPPSAPLKSPGAAGLLLVL
jgi:hypothetical protein